MAKTQFLQIRCSPEDRARLQRMADAEHLDLSTWARRILLQTVDRWEGRQQLRVAEQPAQPFSARPRDKRR